MGRHMSRWWLPSQIKPKFRFLVAISGIVLLAFATLAVAATLFPQSPEAAALPTGPDGPGTASMAPPGPAGQLVARYDVPPTAVWGAGFQAQVMITNTTTTPQPWQVTLVYPQTVTGYVASWVDSAPQPRVSIDGQRFVFASVVPVPAGQTALLRVEFNSIVGTDIAVAECTVNGWPCSQN